MEDEKAKSNQSAFRIIYLRTKPEICLERVRMRNRNAETTLTLSYLEQIHDKYENWLVNEIEDKSIVDVIDANQDLEKIIQDIEEFLE